MIEQVTDLLATQARLINGVDYQTINARNLHKALQSKQDFTHWIKRRTNGGLFTENFDFIVVHNAMNNPEHKARLEELDRTTNLTSGAENLTNDTPTNWTLQNGGQNAIDYFITLDMAKHLCLMEKNEIGKAIRHHFIKAESLLKQIAPKAHRNTLKETKARLASIDRNSEMTDAIKAMIERHHIEPNKQRFMYIREQEMLDSLVLNKNVRKWKAERNITGTIRSQFNREQLEKLNLLQSTNTALINIDMNYHERKGRLLELAQR
ncbi:antA/AntB antirepressor family protein [Lonepinella sp. MS14436]|uniref:antA/AntB antirepressor family protein n=1 Tax=Lonepinella sp. MS14436 TaxID=3003619 RepID=UPI0036DB72B3